MKNLRRLALVGGIAALSAVAFSPKAQAQTTNVDFTGSIPATCTINSTTPGTLALNAPYQFVAFAVSGPGTPGRINVSCSAGTTFTINSIANNGTPAAIFSNLSSNAAISDPSGVLIANYATGTTTSPLQAGPIANKTYEVGVQLTNNGNTALPVGNYGLRVNISLAPQ
jgi:type 1 fimbria pilin